MFSRVCYHQLQLITSLSTALEQADLTHQLGWSHTGPWDTPMDEGKWYLTWSYLPYVQPHKAYLKKQYFPGRVPPVQVPEWAILFCFFHLGTTQDP